MTLRIQSECHYALETNGKIHSWSAHASTQTRGLNTQSLFLNFLPLFLPLCLPAKPRHQNGYGIVWETNWLCLWLGGEDNTGLRSQTGHSSIPPKKKKKGKRYTGPADVLLQYLIISSPICFNLSLMFNEVFCGKKALGLIFNGVWNRIGVELSVLRFLCVSYQF